MVTFASMIKLVRSELVYSDMGECDEWCINPYDLLMLNSLMDLKQRCECKVIGVTMGPASCMDSLQKLFAMGLDDIYLVSDNEFAGSDTFATSYILSEMINKKINADVIVCGEKSVDGETGQIGSQLAKRVGVHCCTGIEEIVRLEENSIIVKNRDMEYWETLKVDLPVVLTYHGLETKQPQYSLPKLKKAKRRQIQIVNAEELDLDKNLCGQRGSKTKVVRICEEKRTNEVFLVEGELKEKADFLYQLLKKEKKMNV